MNYKKNIAITVLVLSSLTSLVINAGEKKHITDIPGYVAHGVNSYNAEPIADYSNATPSVPFLNSPFAIEEVGIYLEGAALSGTITASTDRNLTIATTRSFFDFFNPGGEIDPDTVNVPLGAIGSNVFGPDFTAVDKRTTPTPFPELGTGPTIHRKKGVNANPTIGDWDKISGKLSVLKGRKGGSIVHVTIRNAFPNSLYTLWDIGARNPLSDNEAGYAVPMGGLPNALITDKNGCGFAKVALSYDLLKACEAGAESCSAYVTAFYHWDAQLYGASPAATWAKAPVGVNGANHVVWPTSGEMLINPQTNFKPRRHGCFGH